MNQPMPATPQPNDSNKISSDKPANTGFIKNIIIGVILLAIIILGAYIFNDQAAKKRVRDRAAADKQITDLIYAIRDDARNFYQQNKSYKEWWPKSETLVQVSKLGSTVIYRKPDFQSFVIYAWDQTQNSFFCVDSKNFADYVTTITDSQIKCQ